MAETKITNLTVTVPWKINLPRRSGKDKVIPLNLNTYRNLHYRTNNEAKKYFTDVVIKDQLEGVSLETPCVVMVQVYNPSRRRSDKGNMYGMSSKYLYDAMTTHGVWEDDNDKFVHHEIILPSKLDPDKKGKIEYTFISKKNIKEVTL